MPMADSKRRALDRYNAEKCSQIAIRPLKADAAAIRAAAASAGQSLQGYIVQACQERAARDAAGQPVQAQADQDAGRVRFSCDAAALEAVALPGESAAQAGVRLLRQALQQAAQADSADT